MIRPSDLTYRGEGNNNIILADNKGTIYRIRKTSMPSMLLNKKTRAYKKSRNLTVLFGRHRMAMHFGSHFLHPFKLVNVDSAFLESINVLFQSYRPDFRLDRCVDVSANRILATADATRLSPDTAEFGEGLTLCVEIKPKFGAILLGPERDEIEQISRRFCRFCLMQYHQNRLSMWGNRSSYCPCDLFSGRHDRMMRALSAALQVRQNNLRVFANSRCVLSNDVDELDEALAEFFASSNDEQDDKFDGFSDSPPLPTSIANGNGTNNWHSSSDSVHQTPRTYDGAEEASPPVSIETRVTHDPSPSLRYRFLQELVLPGLLVEPTHSGAVVKRPDSFRYECGFQRCHEDVDAEPFYPSRCLESNRDGIPHDSPLGRIFVAQLQSSLHHQDIIEHYKRVTAYFEEHEISWASYIGGSVIINTKEADSDLIHSLELVERHLVAMAARDCSVMLTFQRSRPGCPKSVLTVGDNGGPRTIVNVSIVDLDPKCLSNLAERVEAEQRVVEQFLKHYQTLRLRQDDEVNENVGP